MSGQQNIPFSVNDVAALIRYEPASGRFFWRCRRAAVREGQETGLCDNGKGYRVIGLFGKLHTAHKIAWALSYGVWPDRDIDHINGDRADNKLSNLRLADRSQNMENAARPRHNVSGYRGVHWSKRAKKWRAVIWKNRAPHHLGFFDDKLDAAAAYATAKQRLHTFHPDVVRRSSSRPA
jgi:hypothetical protein